jgi:EmrB/QacA subfamily drug resistance transporter
VPKTRPIPTTLALLVGTLLSSMDVTVVGTALPRITGQLGGLSLYPWVFSIYLLTSTVTVPIWGKLADLFGRKPMFLAGISMFLIGSAACGAAPTMPLLVAARALQGLGAGAIFPLTQTIFGDIFAVEIRARIQGIFSMVWGISAVLGPSVGGFIVTYWTWPWVFYVNLPVGAVSLLLFAVSFHERVTPRKARLDLAGAFLLVAAISLCLSGLSAHGLVRAGLFASSLLLAGGFLYVERRVVEPLVPLDLFRDRVVAIAAVSGLVTGPMLFAFIAYIPLFLQGAMALPPVWAGLIMAPMSVAWSMATFLGGRFILRSGYRSIVLAGATLLVAGSLGFLYALLALPSIAGWFAFAVSVLLFGAGMGMSFSSFVIATQDRVPWERRGVATALIALLRQLGATLGVAMLGAYVTASLTERLASVPGAPSASALLDPHQLSALSATVLASSRGALGRSIVGVFVVVIALSLCALVLGLNFPDVKAKKSS